MADLVDPLELHKGGMKKAQEAAGLAAIKQMLHSQGAVLRSAPALVGLASFVVLSYCIEQPARDLGSILYVGPDPQQVNQLLWLEAV